jgi:hypothetical protein
MNTKAAKKKLTPPKPKNSHYFQKGNKIATGRPKGAMNEYNKKFLDIQKLAASDAQEEYKKLKEFMRSGEEWAYQLYWKVLYKLPKGWDDATVKVELEELTKKDDVTAYLAEFIHALSRFDEFNKEDIFAAIKALNSVKMTETISESNNIPTTEELKTQLDLVEQLISIKEKK